MSDGPNFLGIDFGTSRSAMAWFNPRTGHAEILKNAEGEEKTPSVVYFGSDGELIGSPAEAMLDEEDERRRVIISAKRSLVRPMHIALPDRPPVTPVDVAATLMGKLRRNAEQGHFQAPVTHAVLTCPASFSESERDALVDAALRAGLQTVELLEEPVAAALACAEAGHRLEGNVLVYDLGGGTFDLAVLTRDDDGFRLALEPRGLRDCGGDDFDRALYDHWDELARETLGRSVSGGDDIDLQFLRLCRQRKEGLTDRERCEFSTYLTGGVRFKHAIEREVFEALIAPRVEETVRLTRAAVEEAGRNGFPVSTVVLIGGSSRVPLVRRLLQEGGGLPAEPQRWQHQDVAVALGAAYHAQALWGPGGGRRLDTADTPARRVAELHRQLRAEMGQAAATGDLRPPARTIARLLALVPRDEFAWEARRALARPLLDRALDATGQISDPEWGAHWQTSQYLAIAGLEVKLGDIPGAARSLTSAFQACHQLSARPKDQFKHFCEIATLWRQVGDEDTARIATAAARTCLEAEIQAYDYRNDKDIDLLLEFGRKLASLEDLGGAKGWFEAARLKIPALKPSPYSFIDVRGEALGSLASAQAEAGDLPGARITLTAIEDLKKRDHQLGGAAKACARIGEIDRAVALAILIADDSCKDDTLQSIAIEQVRKGDATGAVATALKVKELSRLHLFVAHYLEHASRGEIESMLKELMEYLVTRSISPENNNFLVHLLLTLAFERVEQGDLVGARSAFERALSLVGLTGPKGFEGTLAALYARLGDPVLADRWFDAAQKATEAFPKGEHRQWPIWRLAKAYLKAHRFDRARALADLITDQPGPYPRRWELDQQIAVALARVGDFRVAISTAEAIPISATRSDGGRTTPIKHLAFASILAAQLRTGDTPGAIATLNGMERTFQWSDSLRGLAAAALCSGDRRCLEAIKFEELVATAGAYLASIYRHAVSCLLLSAWDPEPDFLPGV